MIVAALALATLAAHAAPTAPAPSSPAASDASPSEEGARSTRRQSENGRVGVALLGGGAALATSTAAGITLMQAVTHPDDDRNPPQHPEITQVSGFVTVSLASVSAALMIIGGALVLEDVLAPPDAAAPPAPSSSSPAPAPASSSDASSPPPPVPAHD